MRILDLFSGIGGFSLAAEWVWGDELEIVGFCENEPYPQKVLKKNFPGVPIYKDIKELDGEAFKDIDLITGGFPCQDISVAGKGAGIEGARSGLWSEMHRLISHIRPRYVIIENVPMLTVRGGTRVISDLAEAGYDAEWQIVGADDVGAWHRRKRIWIVAYLPDTKSKQNRLPGDSIRTGIFRGGIQTTEDKGWKEKRKQFDIRHSIRDSSCGNRKPKTRADVPDTESQRSGSRIHSQAGQSRAEQSKGSDSGKGRNEDLAYATDSRLQKPKTERQHKSLLYAERGSIQGDSPHPHRVGEKRDQSQDRQGIGTEQTRQDVPDSLGKRGCSGDTAGKDAEDARQLRGSPPYGYWDTEPDVGRVANGIPSRVDRLKGLGNAIVPQVAIVIMELIKQADDKPQ
jgi:DNA (cytosine-5)-methyltransferase 1